jgi:hypothetical protein
MSTTSHPIIKVFLKDDFIHLSHDQWHASLSWQDFTNLYHDHLFIVHDDGTQDIDLDKDREFYTWKQ